MSKMLECSASYRNHTVRFNQMIEKMYTRNRKKLYLEKKFFNIKILLLNIFLFGKNLPF